MAFLSALFMVMLKYQGSEFKLYECFVFGDEMRTRTVHKIDPNLLGRGADVNEFDKHLILLI